MIDRLLSVSLDVTVQLTYMISAWLEAGGRHGGGTFMSGFRDRLTYLTILLEDCAALAGHGKPFGYLSQPMV